MDLRPPTKQQASFGACEKADRATGRHRADVSLIPPQILPDIFPPKTSGSYPITSFPAERCRLSRGKSSGNSDTWNLSCTSGTFSCCQDVNRRFAIHNSTRKAHDTSAFTSNDTSDHSSDDAGHGREHRGSDRPRLRAAIGAANGGHPRNDIFGFQLGIFWRSPATFLLNHLRSLRERASGYASQQLSHSSSFHSVSRRAVRPLSSQSHSFHSVELAISLCVRIP